MTLIPIRTLIVDDQPNLRNELRFLIERQGGFSIIGECATVEEARRVALTNKPDLIFLDIQLPDGTGFEVLENLPAEFKIIFLTAFEEHAIRAIKYGALDYLLKPINEIELVQTLNKATQYIPAKAVQLDVAQQYHKKRTHSRLVLRAQDYLQVVEIDQIIYCHSDSGYTSFFLTDGSKIVTSKIIKDYEDVLSESDFFRTHQSYLVNFRYVSKYRKDGFLILKNGIEIPVATRKKEAIMEYFNRL